MKDSSKCKTNEEFLKKITIEVDTLKPKSSKLTEH